MIRVRFAPSPTGFLHIGGVRTALFNFLYARSQKGKFLIRIEDTDRERSKPEFEEEILSSLEWLGLKHDEAIVRQSDHFQKYKEIAYSLVEKGLAYEDKDGDRVAVKFKMPANKASADRPSAKARFTDIVREEVSFDASLFDDLVILKSDGSPTYHLACVVDDHEMQISHVIRGDDHLSNTPRQILLYQALGWKVPKYAHLPLIMGDDGTPLSKRHGAVALSTFRKEGFSQEGLLNYLALLGWGTQGNEELYDLATLIKKFSLKRVNKANAKFNREKLEWVNAQHIKRFSEKDYINRISDYFKGQHTFSEGKWKSLVLLYRSRIKTYQDLTKQASYCFEEIKSYDAEKQKAYLENEALKKHLEVWLDKAGEFSDQDFLDPQKLDQMTRDIAESQGIQAKDLIHPLRFALTGESVSPGLFELMSVLGREVCLKRLKHFWEK